jgi:hypothetical protein
LPSHTTALLNLSAACLFAALVTTPSQAADEVSLLKDLTAVIALLGLPCEQVVSATTQSASEHVARCKNGMRYRVFVNTEGKVVAQKQ